VAKIALKIVFRLKRFSHKIGLGPILPGITGQVLYLSSKYIQE
jgi:hypothetical protein